MGAGTVALHLEGAFARRPARTDSAGGVMRRRATFLAVLLITACAAGIFLAGVVASGVAGERDSRGGSFLAPLPLWGARTVLVIVGLVGWFWTQSLIGKRSFPVGRIGDGLHLLSAPLNTFLQDRPRWANGILIGTSALIDLMGVFLLASAIFGPSIRPFLGLLILYALRQICQGLCALPPPEGMIWRHPGFPSLLVTYGTSTDLFFSGHTAIAVYGAIELAHSGVPWLMLIGVTIAVIEAATVLVLRAHYTMDVFAAVVTALYVAALAGAVAPALDHVLARLAHGSGW